MNARNISILRNPSNRERLIVAEKEGRPALVGVESGSVFPIRRGIPVFVDSSRLSVESRTSRKFYDVLSPFYELTQSFYYTLKGGEEKIRSDYLKYIDAKPGDKVLEISVGNGANLRFLPEMAEYFGIDVSWGQLRRCMRNGTRSGRSIEVYQADAENLPFCDDVFDFVFNVGSINYFENKKKAIAEMVRVAKPGAGIMIVDETEKSARLHNKLPFFRGFFGRAPIISGQSLTHMLPSETVAVEFDELMSGAYFCLRFRKVHRRDR